MLLSRIKAAKKDYGISNPLEEILIKHVLINDKGKHNERKT